MVSMLGLTPDQVNRFGAMLAQLGVETETMAQMLGPDLLHELANINANEELGESIKNDFVPAALGSIEFLEALGVFLTGVGPELKANVTALLNADNHNAGIAKPLVI